MRCITLLLWAASSIRFASFNSFSRISLPDFREIISFISSSLASRRHSLKQVQGLNIFLEKSYPCPSLLILSEKRI